METGTDFPILFYDGSCGFCNRSVQFVLQHERRPIIHFAAIQSEFAARFFKEKGVEVDLSTLYFWDQQELTERSSGALRVTRFLKMPYRLFFAGLIVPRFIRNGIYNFIARRRHRIAGSFCVIPEPEQKKRFLY